MDKGIISKITKINQVLLFLCMVTIIVVFLRIFISEMTRSARPPNGPQIVHNNTKEVLETPLIEKHQHFDYINGTHVFKVLSNQSGHSNEQNLLEEATISRYRKHNKDNRLHLVNFSFLDAQEQQWDVFNENIYIKEYKFSKIGKKPNDSIDSTQFSISKNLYLVISNDTNQDGYLSDDDQLDFFTSNWDGKNLTKTTENVKSFHVIEEDLVLLESQTGYLTYDLANKEFRTLTVKK